MMLLYALHPLDDLSTLDALHDLDALHLSYALHSLEIKGPRRPCQFYQNFCRNG